MNLMKRYAAAVGLVLLGTGCEFKANFNYSSTGTEGDTQSVVKRLNDDASVEVSRADNAVPPKKFAFKCSTGQAAIQDATDAAKREGAELHAQLSALMASATTRNLDDLTKKMEPLGAQMSMNRKTVSALEEVGRVCRGEIRVELT